MSRNLLKWYKSHKSWSLSFHGYCLSRNLTATYSIHLEEGLPLWVHARQHGEQLDPLSRWFFPRPCKASQMSCADTMVKVREQTSVGDSLILQRQADPQELTSTFTPGHTSNALKQVAPAKRAFFLSSTPAACPHDSTAQDGLLSDHYHHYPFLTFLLCLFMRNDRWDRWGRNEVLPPWPDRRVATCTPGQ